MTEPRTTAKRDVWVILDERKKPVARYRSPTREKAIDAFCYPALRKEAYFFDGMRGESHAPRCRRHLVMCRRLRSPVGSLAD
jgi:hypothetical protein